jgi:hypothetical protein
VTGLEPRGFKWVIKGRLAVSERIGGYGIQHRRVRREEEILWLRKEAGINTVVTLLGGGQNIANYQEAGFRVLHEPFVGEFEPEDAQRVFRALDEALESRSNAVLVHRDLVDDAIAGLLAGYLVHSKLVTNPILAIAVIQEILGRPLGPEGRALVPISA